MKIYKDYKTIRVHGHKYGIHSSDNDGVFEAQITPIKPYDEAEYYWAKVNLNEVRYILNGKVKDVDDDIDNYYDLTTNDGKELLISDICDNLNELNASIEPKIDRS